MISLDARSLRGPVQRAHIPPNTLGLAPPTTGTVEIVNNVPLIKKGDKVGASEATLLNMLNISPFAYALIVQYVYDNGSLYEPHVLDIKDSDLLAQFMAGITNVAAVSLAIGYPTLAAIPHMVVNGYKNVLALALATDITFKQAEKAKAFLADPEAALAAMAAAAPAAAAAVCVSCAPRPFASPLACCCSRLWHDVFAHRVCCPCVPFL